MNTLFIEQKEFENKLIKLNKLTVKEREKWTKEFVLACHTELSELLSEVNWKTHKTKGKRIVLSSIEEEIADVFIYAINFCLLWQIDSDRIQNVIFNKIQKNKKRFL